MQTEAYKNGYGEIRKASTGYWYFLPSLDLPKDIYTPEIVKLLSEADRKLGELSGLGLLIPNPDLLVRPYIRREAVQSSRIEGTQANLADIFLGEVTEVPQQNTNDVQEVRNYVHAMEQGLKRLGELPLSMRLLRELHSTLMTDVRGNKAMPGEVRRSQNWIGSPGSTPETATYVPPAPHDLPSLLTNWEKQLNIKDGLPPLLHVAILHWQFESIHPFLDGNGRIGRLLITLYLCERGELSQPLLYLSEYFQEHRNEYLDYLAGVSQKQDWKSWLSFFLIAVRKQAEDAIATSKKLFQLQQEYRDSLHHARVTPSTFLLLEQLFRNPFTTAKVAAKKLKISPPAARTAIAHLERLHIIEEVSGKERNRIYGAKKLLQILDAER